MYTTKKYKCVKCNNLFSAKGGNYNKHIAVCDGFYQPFKKLSECKYCAKLFIGMTASERANHSRWCIENPKREKYNKDMTKARSCITAESIEKRGNGIRAAHKNGKYFEAAKKSIETKRKRGNLGHTEKTKQIIREKALASKHRRVLRSTREYIKTDGSVVLLDSSWEEALAIRLDFLNIDWVRPDSIKWVDDNDKSHNYFPDFYLTEYDLYLDPKNDQVYRMTIDKIKKITKLLPNLKILRTLDECKNFII